MAQRALARVLTSSLCCLRLLSLCCVSVGERPPRTCRRGCEQTRRSSACSLVVSSSRLRMFITHAVYFTQPRNRRITRTDFMRAMREPRRREAEPEERETLDFESMLHCEAASFGRLKARNWQKQELFTQCAVMWTWISTVDGAAAAGSAIALVSALARSYVSATM